MSLSDRLRELAELQTKLRSETCMGVPWEDNNRAFRDVCTLTHFAALLAAAERLEAENARLRELVREAWFESAGSMRVKASKRDQLELWELSEAKALLDKEVSDG